jgi:hypothetical protein
VGNPSTVLSHPVTETQWRGNLFRQISNTKLNAAAGASIARHIIVNTVLVMRSSASNNLSHKLKKMFLSDYCRSNYLITTLSLLFQMAGFSLGDLKAYYSA